MKKHTKFFALALMLGTLTLTSCTTTPHIGDNGNWWYETTDLGVSATGPTGTQGDKGDQGFPGVSVIKIEKTNTEGNVDTYTITYSDGKTSTFIVVNGANGVQGIQGVPGEDGHYPVVKIGDNGNWLVDNVDTEIKAQGPKGDKGDKGDTGDEGPKGDKGDTGITGKSAYEAYIEAHPEYTGNEQQWLDDLLNGRLGNKEKHTVKFNTGCDVIVPDQIIEHGEKIVKPVDPTRTNYEFAGWEYQGELWSFAGYSVTCDLTLDAKWIYGSLHEIEVINNPDVDFECLPKVAKDGDLINFKVFTSAKLYVESLTIKYENGQSEIVYSNKDGIYSFRMPDQKICISANVVCRYFDLGIYNVASPSESEVPLSEYVSKIIVENENEFDFINDSSISIRAGSEVKILVKHKLDGSTPIFYLHGVSPSKSVFEKVSDNENNGLFLYKFRMPSCDARLGVKREEHEIKIDFIVPEGITASAYIIENGVQTSITSAKVGQEIYISTTEIPSVLRTKIKYKTRVYLGETSSIKQVFESKCAGWDDRYYDSPFYNAGLDTKSFVIPEEMYVEPSITIKIDGLDAIYYGQEFVGKYEGITFDKNNDVINYEYLNINKAGVISSDISSIDSSVITNVNGNNFTIKDSRGVEKQAVYENGLFVFSPDSKNIDINNIAILTKSTNGIEYTIYKHGNFNVIGLIDGTTAKYVYVDTMNFVLDVDVKMTQGVETDCGDIPFDISKGNVVLAKNVVLLPATPSTLGDVISSAHNDDCRKELYKTTVKVKSFCNKNGGLANSAAKEGFLKVTDLKGQNEAVINGSSASPLSILFNNTNYVFNNTNDFLTNEVTKDIKPGYELDIVCFRDDYVRNMNNRKIWLKAVISKVTEAEPFVEPPLPAGMENGIKITKDAFIASYGLIDFNIGDTSIMGNYVGNFGNSIQFKKQVGYLYNDAATGKAIAKIVLTYAYETYTELGVSFGASCLTAPGEKGTSTKVGVVQTIIPKSTCNFFRIDSAMHAVNLKSIEVYYVV